MPTDRRVRPRILFLINSLAGGGAERVMSTLLANSSAEAEEFEITLGLLDDAEIAYDLPPWLAVRSLNCRGKLLDSCMATAALARRQRPDVTLSFLTRANVSATYAAMSCGHPAILSERTHTSRHLGKGMHGLVSRNLVRATYPRAEKVIAVSSGVREDLTRNFGLEGGRVVTIENPVDVTRLRALAAEEAQVGPAGSYIIAVGRLDPLKRFDMLIQAFAQARPADRLLILGEGPDRARLQALAVACGVADFVDMPGFAANPFALLARAKFCVLCSDYEGFPNSLVEAMALGTPVIATNCRSGPSEILARSPPGEIQGVTQTPNGILIPPGSLEALVRAMQMLDEESIRRDIGQAAALRAMDFDVGAVCGRYWDLVRQTLADTVVRRRAGRTLTSEFRAA
jgi:glycosyltransferase involved in cell wall biosynthesis